ncbi:zinc-ribbon domain-containing protein [Anaplasma marginale]|uniref:zinc-ribbon domain-containing protein n=1 Tax=Anaplasma marginale TaxID=770 RepID=UPI001F51F0C8|nr:zinc-ribbon domain-containing protein [Anaplasma marginale]
MKIECKNCHATYSVARDKMPAKGKKVKCTNCGHVWFFLPRKAQLNLPAHPL